MKTLKKLLYIIPLLGAMITSCTDVENIEVEHIGGYNTLGNSEYYANLRAYKETAKNYGRPVAFGWFSNWAPSGVMRKGYLSSVPDSMDIISMWSGAPGRYEITEAQKADKEFAQKVKGIKAVLKDRELQMIVDSAQDISLELGLLKDKVAFFEEVFGIRLVLRRKGRA